MAERRERGPYFFDAATVAAWTRVAAAFERPCLLCAPTVGAELHGRRVPAAVLDVDERFAYLPGFRKWNLASPQHVPDRFGVILCDPPFFAVSVGRLGAAIDMLAGHDAAQPLAVSYLKRREAVLLRRFERYGVRPTGVKAGYWTMDTRGRNEIEVYANFEWPGAGVVQGTGR